MYRSGPARGPNPIRTQGSTCAPLSRLPPPLFFPPTAKLGTRNRERGGELGEPRGEEPVRVPNQRSKEVGAGGSQPAGTMRRASKKSSSSAATASAGKAPPSRIPSSPPCFRVPWSGRELPGVADAFLFARLDAGAIFLRKIQSRGRAAPERADGPVLWWLVTRCMGLWIARYEIWRVWGRFGWVRFLFLWRFGLWLYEKVFESWLNLGWNRPWIRSTHNRCVFVIKRIAIERCDPFPAYVN